jgi:hypothetical protein
MLLSNPRRHRNGPLEDEIRWAPQSMDKQAFVDALTAEMPAPPADMARIVDANLRGVVPAAAHA